MRLLAFAVVLCTALAAEAVPPPIPNLATVVLAGSAPDLPLADASGGAPGTLVDVVVADVPGVVVDVDVGLDLEHLEPGHLDVYLVAPSGTTITLTTDNGGSADDVFRGVLFDDQAAGDPAPSVRNAVYATGVPVGAVQPEEALGAVRGEPAAGPWALVVNDDTGGTRGTLRSWSLTLHTLGALMPAAPIVVAGGGGPIPDGQAQGRASDVVVAGAGARLLDLAVTVDVTHGNAADLDMTLTAPSGRRVELVTDVGGGNDDLYAGTTFDDRAGEPVSDLTVPASGEAFAAVVPEGALSAFLGEDANGTWTLTVADDQGGSTGTLQGWSLSVTAGTACGDGTLDAGETCDDGNAVDGDGCDGNCTATGCGNGVVTAGEDCDDGNTAGGDGCPAACRLAETSCGDCVDDDGNGLVDAADPACGAAPLELQRVAVAAGRGRLRVGGTLGLPADMAGDVGLVLADGDGTVVCTPLGTLAPGRRPRPLKARVGPARLTLKLVPRAGRFTLVARGLDLSALDASGLRVGLRLGARHFTGTNVSQ